MDDEVYLHRVIAEGLGMNGYAVLGAQSPREALLIGGIHWGPIDLLLTDVVMPEMSGFVLADRLQASRPGLQVLYMSGYVDRDAIRYRIEERGAALLMKPFTPAELLRCVREVFGSTPAGFRARDSGGSTRWIGSRAGGRGRTGRALGRGRWNQKVEPARGALDGSDESACSSWLPGLGSNQRLPD